MHSSNLILKGEHQGSKLSKEIKFGKAYSGEERYFAQLALNKLSFLVYNRQLTDTSQLLHKLVQLYVEEEGLSYERLIKV